MGGLCEDRFGGSGRGVENEMEEWGVETGGADGSEMGQDGRTKHNSMTSIDASLTPDFRNKEESNIYILEVVNSTLRTAVVFGDVEKTVTTMFNMEVWWYANNSGLISLDLRMESSS